MRFDPYVKVRKYEDSDWGDWLRMSLVLFPDGSADDLSKDMRSFLARPDGAVFVIDRPVGGLAGYVEVGSRPYADGCSTSPVGYIEAWYVDPDVRLQGYGRALLSIAESWARGRGYQEMASDALLDNHISHHAHESAGYVEVGRIVQFRKPLGKAK